MSAFQVKDANGKTFEGTIESLISFNGDLVDSKGNALVVDSASKLVDKVPEVVFKDSSGNQVSPEELIADIQSGDSDIIAIDVLIEASHSGDNLNYFVYYEDSMENDAVTFMNPFEKPLLKNHNTMSEPMGRIKMAYTKPSSIIADRTALMLDARVTDKDAIVKFLDGRYKTVSIGGSCGSIQCNICGKTIVKDGKMKFCGHWRGETYNNKMCYWGARGITYNEVSTVNTPADMYAQALEIKVVTSDKCKKKKTKGADNMEGNEATATTDSGVAGQGATTTDRRQQFFDFLDSMTKEATAATATTDATTTTETGAGEAGAGATTTEAGTTSTADTQTTEGATATTTDYKAQLDTANATIADLNTTIADLNKKLETAYAEKEKAEKDLTDSKTEMGALRDNLISMSVMTKEIVVDSLIEKSKIADSEIGGKKAEYMAKSMKELQAMKDSLDSAKANQTRTTAPAVSNPSLSVGDGKNTSAQATNAKAEKPKDSIMDIVNGLISK